MFYFSLTPLRNLTRFMSSNIKNEVYVVTEDRCIKSNGVLLAARSVKIEEILEESENIPAVQFSDNMAGLEDCLDLVYGGSVDIREGNCKSIYKFGKLFQICEMMVGVLGWIAYYATYDNFWSVYLDLMNLHVDASVFVHAIKRYLSAAGDNFVEHTTEICHNQDKNTITSVVELLSKINDIRVIFVIENIIDTATENNESVVATISSTHTNNYLQTVVSSSANYIENYLQTNNCDELRKSRCMLTLQKASSVCTNMETLRKINKILSDTNIQAITSIQAITNSYKNFAVHSIKDLNWKRVKQLTSPIASYGAIKYFAEEAGQRIHPCVVVEIVLKWWSKRADTGEVDMSFIKPLITTILTVCTSWYYSVSCDERYKDLIKTLNIPEPTTARYVYYNFYHSSYKRYVKDCISEGDGTPAGLDMRLECPDDKMSKTYRRSMPDFRYDDDEFPPYRYRYTKHHWYITTYNDKEFAPKKFVSLITDSKDKILSLLNFDTDYRNDFDLNFVPRPGTFW